MNIATNVEERHSSSAEVIAVSLEAMPRARDLGTTALDLCDVAARKVMSGHDFVIAVRQATESIVRWSRGVALPEEVIAFCETSDEELIKLQKKNHFSKVQLIQWTGEMKLQLFEARHNPPQ